MDKAEEANRGGRWVVGAKAEKAGGQSRQSGRCTKRKGDQEEEVGGRSVGRAEELAGRGIEGGGGRDDGDISG